MHPWEGELDNFHPRLLREMAKQTAGLVIYCSNLGKPSVTGEKQKKNIYIMEETGGAFI